MDQVYLNWASDLKEECCEKEFDKDKLLSFVSFCWQSHVLGIYTLLQIPQFICKCILILELVPFTENQTMELFTFPVR